MLLTTWITTYHKKAPLMQDNVTWRSAITEQNINKYRHFYVYVSKKIIALTTFSITTRPWLSIIPFRVCTSRIPHRLYSLHVHKQTVSQAHTSWMKLFVCRHLPEKKRTTTFNTGDFIVIIQNHHQQNLFSIANRRLSSTACHVTYILYSFK